MPLVLIANQSFESLEQFRFWRKTLTNQNFVHEEIKSTLKSWSACVLMQNLWPSSFLSKIIKLKIYKVVILPVILYG